MEPNFRKEGNSPHLASWIPMLSIERIRPHFHTFNDTTIQHKMTSMISTTCTFYCQKHDITSFRVHMFRDMHMLNTHLPRGEGKPKESIVKMLIDYGKSQSCKFFFS